MKGKKRRIHLLVVTSILAFLLIIPCFSTFAASEKVKTIKIGFFSAESDASLDFYSPWSRQGFELGIMYATNGTNATIAGKPYEIIYYNTKGLVNDAETIARSSIENDEIDILIGGTYSTVAEKLASVAEEYQKLYFITPAASSDLTGKNFNPYIFRIARNSWHDALAGVTYAIDTLDAENFTILAADYSFGWSGVETMSKVITEKNGSLVLVQYADLTTTDFTPYITNILTADGTIGIDYLLIIWSGRFDYLYSSLGQMNVADYMYLGGAIIDIHSTNLIETQLNTNNLTLEGATGFCLYGYKLANNSVNDWMVEQHELRNIKPNAKLRENYRVPELFTASGFATAQFIVNVTNAVPGLDVYDMIKHLESNLTIDTPKGKIFLRPEDHQALVEMYIARLDKDTNEDSETFGLLIPELVEKLDPLDVAPPVENDWVPGSLTKPRNTPGFKMLGGLIALSIWITSKRKRRR
ncbi:MAG: substrate-binding domain-containing protein [Candidatus Odinarchaeota archaeon]